MQPAMLAHWDARIPKNCPKHVQNCSAGRPLDCLVSSHAGSTDYGFKAHHVPCGPTIGVVVMFVQMAEEPWPTFKLAPPDAF